MVKARRKSPGVRGYVLQPLSATARETWSALFKPITVLYPYESEEEREELRRRFRGQHEVDWLKCIGCALCYRVCPNKCITMEDIKVEDSYEGPFRSVSAEKKKLIHRPGVDIGRCLFCGNCSEYCPTGAWSHTENFELADFSREALVYSAEQLRRDKQPTKEVVNRIQENPILDEETCIGCRRCSRECPTRCIEMIPGRKMRKGKPIENPRFDYSMCIGCGSCVEVCPSKSLTMEEI
ncbi:MAG: 4Fe-4S binding protein [Thermoplasmata archaeon]